MPYSCLPTAHTRSWIVLFRMIGLMATGICMALPGACKAELLFSTFGPDLGYDSANGITLSGPASPFPQLVALPFSFPDDSLIDSVDLAVGSLSSLSDVTVRIYSDFAGNPSEIVEEAMASGFASGVVSVRFAEPVRVLAAYQYWLGVAPLGASELQWNDSTSEAFGLQAISINGGASWSVASSEPFPQAAFRLHGEVTSSADLILVEEQSAWRFCRGLSDPSVGIEWTTPSFADQAWDFGIEGFGFDIDPTTQAGLMKAVHTPLLDMREDNINANPYSSVYLRREFPIDDAAHVTELVLQLDYDDSFIAYVNGTEVARSLFGTTGTPEPFDAYGADHESTNGDEEQQIPRFHVDIEHDFPGLLHDGNNNVLAIHGLNRSLDDNDFTLSRIKLEANVKRVLVGDYNADELLDGLDVDALVDRIVVGDAAAEYDLNGDLRLDIGDLSSWLAVAGKHNLASGAAYLPGDANLDGIVNVIDFELWNMSKFGSTHQWTLGNFNADSVIDVSDFNIWHNNQMSSSQLPLQAVPEPIYLAHCASMIGLYLVLRQHRCQATRCLTNRV